METHHDDGDLAWKRACMEGVRSWEQPLPPQPGDTTVLCKKHVAQESFAPPTPLKPLLSFAEKVESNAKEKADTGRAWRW